MSEHPPKFICEICGGAHLTHDHAMGIKKTFPKLKSREDLQEQLKSVEELVEEKLIPQRISPEEIFSMTEQELKGLFPKRYELYIHLLREQKSLKKNGDEIKPELTQMIEAKNWLSMLNSLDEYVETYEMEVSEDPRHPVQQEVFRAIRAFLEDGHLSGYVKLPTGSGKTVLFKRFLEAVRLRSLIVVPNNVLVEQTIKRLSGSALGDDIGVLNQHAKDFEAESIVTTYASLIRNVENGKIKSEDFSCLVLDEAHKALGGKASETIDKFRHAIRIGFTATPKYTETKTLAQILDREIFSMEVAEAIRAGMLSSARTLAVKTTVDLASIGIRNGEYIESELAEKINNQGRNQLAVDYYTSNFRDKQGIAYCAGVDHAIALADLFKKTGIPAEVISGRLKRAERNAVLERFNNGSTKILSNADILIEGFDDEKVSVCLNLRPTMSAVIAEQRGGRVLRLNDAEPDKVGYVVDFLDDDALADNLSRPYPILYREVLGAVAVPRALASEGIGGKGGPTPPKPIELIAGLKVVGTEEQFTEILRTKDAFKKKMSKRKLAREEKAEKLRREAERQERERQSREEFNVQYPRMVKECNTLVDKMRNFSQLLSESPDKHKAERVLQQYRNEVSKAYKELVTELRECRSGSGWWTFVGRYPVESEKYSNTAKYFQKKIDKISQMLIEIEYRYKMSQDDKMVVWDLSKAELESIREKSKGLTDWKTKAELKNLAGKFKITVGEVITAVNRLTKIHLEWVDKRLEPKGNVVNVYSPEFVDELIKQLGTQ